MRPLLLVVLVACDGGRAPRLLDARAEPVAYRLTVRDAEPMFRPPRDPMPTVLIDGEPQVELVALIDDLIAAPQHRVELAFGDVVIAALAITPSGNPCGITEPIRSYWQSICSYASGDLRFAGEFVESASSTCTGDGFCVSGCSSCKPGERCTSLVVSKVPLASRLGCAPGGPRLDGQTCSLNDEPVAFDDCGTNLLCVGGVCRRTCDPNSTNCGCTYVEGHAPELGVCAP